MSDKSEIYSLRRHLDEAARRRDVERALSGHEPGPEMRISLSASEFWPVGASRSLPDKGRPLRGRCAVWVASLEKPLMMTPMFKLAAVAPITLFEHDKPAITVRLSSISGSAKEWQAVVGLDGEHLYYVARLLRADPRRMDS